MAVRADWKAAGNGAVPWMIPAGLGTGPYAQKLAPSPAAPAGHRRVTSPHREPIHCIVRTPNHVALFAPLTWVRLGGGNSLIARIHGRGAPPERSAQQCASKERQGQAYRRHSPNGAVVSI